MLSCQWPRIIIIHNPGTMRQSTIQCNDLCKTHIEMPCHINVNTLLIPCLIHIKCLFRITTFVIIVIVYENKASNTCCVIIYNHKGVLHQRRSIKSSVTQQLVVTHAVLDLQLVIGLRYSSAQIRTARNWSHWRPQQLQDNNCATTLTPTYLRWA